MNDRDAPDIIWINNPRSMVTRTIYTDDDRRGDPLLGDVQYARVSPSPDASVRERAERAVEKMVEYESIGGPINIANYRDEIVKIITTEFSNFDTANAERDEVLRLTQELEVANATIEDLLAREKKQAETLITAEAMKRAMISKFKDSLDKLPIACVVCGGCSVNSIYAVVDALLAVELEETKP